MEMEQRLEEAIENGEVLRVTYAGGSQPGAERDIAPISIKNGKVRARCYTSNAVKSFVIGKMSLLEKESGSTPEWSPDYVKPSRYDTLDDVVAAMADEWKSAGWHVEQSVEHIGLHMLGKHKKLLKYPTVSISYDPHIHELYMDLDGNFQEPDRERQKPWVVSAKDYATTSFKKFEKAAERFIERSRQVTPNR